MPNRVFITGGTGYIGSRLIPLLVSRGHNIRALVRKGSERKLPGGAEPVVGSALEMASYAGQMGPADTFIHLVGVSHPSPAKAAQFRSIDLVSGKAAIGAATVAGVRHFIYLSVAQPAPVMKAYIAVRAECEEAIRVSGVPATFVRPWYVLGPGHRWPFALIPIYRICEMIPATRAGARRLGLVRLPQILNALAWAVEHPSKEIRVMDVPAIRELKFTRPFCD